MGRGEPAPGSCRSSTSRRPSGGWPQSRPGRSSSAIVKRCRATDDSRLSRQHAVDSARDIITREHIMELSDKAVLITGGKRIGAAIAIELAARGMHVALAYNRSRTEAESVAKEIAASGRRAVALQADLSKARELSARSSSRRFPRSAGSTCSSTWRRSTPSCRSRRPMRRSGRRSSNVDLRAAFLCARAAVPHMRSAGGRTDRQLLRLGRGKRPSPVPGISRLLRRQERQSSA